MNKHDYLGIYRPRGPTGVRRHQVLAACPVVFEVCETFVPPQPMLQRRHYVYALSVATFVPCHRNHKNIEVISMKFAGDNHYHQ